MISENQIIDTPLPADRNFHYLKTQGIEYLLQLAGNNWTNFNESDPGIVILDQLCLALTELGYCQNFPIEDILTQVNGKIGFENQFFTPAAILTSTPVTEIDYRKLLIDRLAEVKNAYIELVRIEEGGDDILNGGMQVYLLTDNRNPGPNDLNAEDLIIQAQRLLNTHRNLAQWFKPPQVLTPVEITLSGKVQLANGVSASDMRTQILLALDNFVSATICQHGYQALIDQGVVSEDIFNGPQMDNGWILDSDLVAQKLSLVALNAVSGLVSAQEGVRSVSGLKMVRGIEEDSSPKTISISAHEVAFFTLDAQCFVLNSSAGAGKTTANDPEEKLARDLLALQQQHVAAGIDASVDLAPDLPTGHYRDIANYYPLQNTFPADYGIGPESVPTGSSEYRVAQARQLKGYLMVFEQLLSNQFCQLAELGQLFSFTGVSTIASSGSNMVDKPYDGIPTQLFSPTYFSQPLYQVPDVKPLLLGNQMYRYGPQPITTPAQEQDIWQKFQQNPFNRYMSGLREAMEGDTQRDDRRNRMLDHLLARHGESPSWLDNIIHTVRWYGSTVKTRIIVKSLLLQNYQRLSYYHPKGYSNLIADKLAPPARYHVTDAKFDYLGTFDRRLGPSTLSRFVNQGSKSREYLIKEIDNNSIVGQLKLGWDENKINGFDKLVIEDGNATALIGADTLWSDGQLNLDALAADIRFTDRDVTNFATVEMQLNLLLGLKQHYQWLAQILVTLIDSSEFAAWLNGDTSKSFALLDSDWQIRVERQSCAPATATATHQQHVVYFGNQQMLTIGNKIVTLPTRKLYQAHLEQIQWLSHRRQGGLLLEPALWLMDVNPQQPGGLTRQQLGQQNDPYLRTFFVLPGYVSLFIQDEFVDTLNQLVSNYWPMPIENHYLKLDFSCLRLAISNYIHWHNGQCHPAKKAEPGKPESPAYEKQAKAPRILARLVFPNLPKNQEVQPKSEPTDEPKGGSV